MVIFADPAALEAVPGTVAMVVLWVPLDDVVVPDEVVEDEMPTPSGGLVVDSHGRLQNRTAEFRGTADLQTS